MVWGQKMAKARSSRSKGNGSTVLRAEEVRKLHDKLALHGRDLLPSEVSVVPKQDLAGWANISVNTKVLFEMCAKDRALGDYAQTAKGSRCPVLQVFPSDEMLCPVWVSWGEEWRSLGGGTFSLVGLGWKFFWGPYLRKKNLLFRAEWDIPEERGERAAQPHWHFDRELLAEFLPRIPHDAAPSQHQGDLQELPAYASGSPLEEFGAKPGLQVLDLHGLHLGMGGWCHAKAHPTCWHHPVVDVAGILRWAKSTLEYAKAQFDRLKPGEIVD